jgi:hypothetical protein
LVAGDVDGQIGQLYKRVNTLLQKPPKFQVFVRVPWCSTGLTVTKLLLCTGNFFREDGFVDEEWAKYTSGQQASECLRHKTVARCVGGVHTRGAPRHSNAAVPIPTYILGPKTPEQAALYESAPRGGDLCENVTFLGKPQCCVSTLAIAECPSSVHSVSSLGASGTTQLVGGLRVAYVSGAFAATAGDEVHTCSLSALAPQTI